MLAYVCAQSRAEDLKLQIRDGRLDARDVRVYEILAEWARVGETTFVNADRIEGPPITLQLDAVPERQAFATVLEEVSGYVTTPASATAGHGASTTAPTVARQGDAGPHARRVPWQRQIPWHRASAPFARRPVQPFDVDEIENPPPVTTAVPGIVGGVPLALQGAALPGPPAPIKPPPKR